ncbi:putative myrcene synthase [Lupinus albus]|uniref:Putative myrcene synthase n=1 Tax=Lupinus albus TaxID=3870 RepID=A0A6A4NUC7_LUPAL|nr:putative myrcene synthase [Lupinus albus]
MALLQLASLPNSFTNMLHLERKSAFTATKPFQCRASNKSFPNSQTIPRRSAKFQPSTWNYDYIQSLNSEYMASFHSSSLIFFKSLCINYIFYPMYSRF